MVLLALIFCRGHQSQHVWWVANHKWPLITTNIGKSKSMASTAFSTHGRIRPTCRQCSKIKVSSRNQDKRFCSRLKVAPSSATHSSGAVPCRNSRSYVAEGESGAGSRHRAAPLSHLHQLGRAEVHTHTLGTRPALSSDSLFRQNRRGAHVVQTLSEEACSFEGTPPGSTATPHRAPALLDQRCQRCVLETTRPPILDCAHMERGVGRGGSGRIGTLLPPTPMRAAGHVEVGRGSELLKRRRAGRGPGRGPGDVGWRRSRCPWSTSPATRTTLSCFPIGVQSIRDDEILMRGAGLASSLSSAQSCRLLRQRRNHRADNLSSKS